MRSSDYSNRSSFLGRARDDLLDRCLLVTVLADWYERASANRRRVALADGSDPRALAAAAELNERDLVEAVVIDDPGRFRSARLEQAAGSLTKPVDLDDPLAVAALMVKCGDADACVAGASRTTSDVIRTGLRVLGVAPNANAVSSSFFFVLPDGTPIVYGDCGVLPDPDAEQLASVAISSAATFEQLSGESARVAMLSFSTKGSAEHARVDKVRAATGLAQALAPGLAIDGELQFDAAWVPAVAESKAPGSTVAGYANVFIFPDLDAANIAYKITERLGRAQAFGPLLQGLGGVMHDLSRGCTADDIVNVSVIAALQATS